MKDYLLNETKKVMFELGPECKLWGLVNNAGIARMGYIEWLKLATFRQVMDVNFFGHVAVTKAFLPFLRRCPGSRIVNISSILGLAGTACASPYVASKFALEGFTQCLLAELYGFST